MDGVWNLAVLNRLTMILGLAMAGVSGNAGCSEPPTVRRLIESTSMISTADPQLRAVAAKYEFSDDDSVWGGQVCWTRERGSV